MGLGAIEFFVGLGATKFFVGLGATEFFVGLGATEFFVALGATEFFVALGATEFFVGLGAASDFLSPPFASPSNRNVMWTIPQILSTVKRCAFSTQSFSSIKIYVTWPVKQTYLQFDDLCFPWTGLS